MRIQHATNLCRQLFDRIDGATTPAEFWELGAALDRLRPVIDAQVPGLGTQLWLWLGLKQDGITDMANDYRDKLLQEFDDLRR